MRISSKKILAIALSVAMLASCMVFSFSASAATGLMWENDFDKTGNGWRTQYKDMGTTDDAHNNTRRDAAVNSAAGTYSAVYGETDGNGYMKMRFDNYASGNYVNGFRVFHQAATSASDGYGYKGNDNASANGNFKPTDGSYAVELQYNLESLASASGASVELYVLFKGQSWNGDLNWNKNINTSLVGKGLVATLTAADLEKGWQTAVLYFDNLDFSSEAMHIAVKRAEGYSDSLTGTEIQIDNIKVYKYEQKSTITFMYNGQSVGTATGVDGMTASVPEFDSGSEDLEFYSDPLFENKLTEIKFGAADSIVYIKTVGAENASNVWSFEKEELGTDLDVKSDNAAVSNTMAYTGSKSLRAVLKTQSGADRTQFYIKNSAGQPVFVTQGKGYIISYYIRVTDEGTSATTRLNTWFHAGDGSASRGSSTTKLLDDGAVETKTINDQAGWVKITKYIESAAASGQLLFGITCRQASASAYDVVYLDDFTVTCVDDIVLNADDQGRAQYLYQQRIDANNATSLHKYYGNNPAKTDAYTSMYLGATYRSNANGLTISLNGEDYLLAARGIEVLNTDGTATAMKHEITADQIKTHVEVSGNNYTYAMLLQNMSKAWFEDDTQYQYRGYYDITVEYLHTDGTTQTYTKRVNGELSDPFSFKSLAGENNFNVANNDSVYWFDDLA